MILKRAKTCYDTEKVCLVFVDHKVRVPLRRMQATFIGFFLFSSFCCLLHTFFLRDFDHGKKKAKSGFPAAPPHHHSHQKITPSCDQLPGAGPNSLS